MFMKFILYLQICLLITGEGLIAANLQLETVSGTKVIENLLSEHPRVLVAPGMFQHIKNRIQEDSILKSWYGRIHQSAEQILEMPPVEYNLRDGVRLLSISRTVLNRIYTLSFVYHMEGKQAYQERAWHEMQVAAKFPDWNPDHFLDTAEMTHALAIGYDWLYHTLTPDQKAIIVNAIVQKGFQPYLLGFKEGGKWVDNITNWNFVCNGGIGIGALAVGDRVPEIAAEVLENGFSSLPLALASYRPDGGWDESPSYWRYGTHYLTIFMAALRSTTGSVYEISKYPGIEYTPYFPIYMSTLSNTCFGYGDSSQDAVSDACMFWFAKELKEPELGQWRVWHLGHSEHNVTPLDILWYDSAFDGTEQLTSLSLDQYFRRVEVASFRSNWQKGSSIFLGLKGRAFEEQHHTDLDHGTFYLEANGVRWTEELGGDYYNLPGYWDYSKTGTRWQYYRKRAEGQNTLVINPDEGPNQDPTAVTKIVRFESNPDMGYAIVDLTPVYRKYAESVKRGVALFEHRSKVVVQDEIQLNSPGDIWWFFHTSTSITLAEKGQTAILSSGGEKLLVHIITPEDAVFSIMPAAPLPQSPHPKNQNPNKGVRKLAIHIHRKQSTRITVLLIPYKAESSVPEYTISVLPLWFWEGDNFKFHR